MFARRLKFDDWLAYKALRLEALQNHPDVFGEPYGVAAMRSDDQWQDILSQNDQAFFGLFDGDILIGSGGLYLQDAVTRTGILIGGYIKHEYRGRGLSRLIYKARIEWAKESGLFNRLVVGHRAGNEASRRANKAFGFKPIADIEYSFGDGTKGIEHQYEVRLR